MKLSDVLKTWRVQGSALLAELFGGLMINDALWDQLVTLTYGPNIASDASQGNAFVVTITDGVAMALSAPTNPPPAGASSQLTYTFRNASGGVAGALTFNAIFKTIAAAWTQPANGFSRSIVFRWNGTNYVEVTRTAADVAN